jgi:shikimate dehydrogenase
VTISGKTRIYAVAGSPVAHSLSPLIHNFLFQKFNIDAVYVALPVDVENFPSLISSLAMTSFDGVNITTPHKTKLVGRKLLLKLSKEAEELSAVNTLKRVGHHWEGYNTDGSGLCDFIELDCRVSLSNTKITVLGAGPAAKAVVLEIIRRDGKVSVLNRSEEGLLHPFWQNLVDRGSICADFSCSGKDSNEILSSADIIINGTGYGQGGRTPDSTLPWKMDSLSPSLVIDMNYGKEKLTPFLKLFGKTINCFNGRGMLMRQACLAFTIWTGFEVNEDVQEALELYIGSY